MCADVREAIRDGDFRVRANEQSIRCWTRRLEESGRWSESVLVTSRDLRHASAGKGEFNWCAILCCWRGLLGDGLPRKSERDSGVVRVRGRCGLAMRRVRTPCKLPRYGRV